MNKKTKFIANAGLIAATYVVMTFLSSIVGLASGAIQVRISEGLNILACFTGAAVPGMYIGCIAANLLTGGCALDLAFGSLATLLGVFIGRQIAKIRNGKLYFLVPVPTILSNAIIVPLVLQYGYNINMPYRYLFVTVGVGEVISAGIIGIVFYHALNKVPVFRRMISDDTE